MVLLKAVGLQSSNGRKWKYSRGGAKKMGMGRYALRSRLVFLFFVVCIAAEEVMADGNRARMPGFIYTRNRGRCTPQFWSSRREAWPKMIPQASSVSKVFGSRALERFKYDLTLLEATQRNDDGGNAFSRLLKQSSAALLNSYARKGYPYSAWEVKTLLIQALVSEEAAALQAQRFSIANQVCI